MSQTKDEIMAEIERAELEETKRLVDKVFKELLDEKERKEEKIIEDKIKYEKMICPFIAKYKEKLIREYMRTLRVYFEAKAEDKDEDSLSFLRGEASEVGDIMLESGLFTDDEINDICREVQEDYATEEDKKFWMRSEEK